ncbi:hypothetical protein OC846_002275 [Tilletia horrida]|uniref:Uncharacterized protein n=1 Tax=Tilletia horrida TaxID=155126 RepID=A0AAN6GS87_9BASI|nr:hypothetical protein OC845_004544 [Tilletia horrida]KAK0554054.1 hypothetical protein OC846_002275 [Tilletia horrida]KAK0568036.1 hypothetical protein OC861_002351 [Tilletia horrida]
MASYSTSSALARASAPCLCQGTSSARAVLSLYRVAPQSQRSFSHAATLGRNLPARRPLDPLDTAPNAVRHRLTSGETFIVRPAPSAVTTRISADPAPAADGQDASARAQSLFPGFAGPSRSTSNGAPLPPLLKPKASPSRTSKTVLSADQISELRELRLSTAASSEPGSDSSVRALADKFGVSPTFVRIVAPLPSDLRRTKLAEQESRVGREFWGFRKRLARFERRVRKELW